eukprot:751548-Hanusia_phi.AAC.1
MLARALHGAAGGRTNRCISASSSAFYPQRVMPAISNSVAAIEKSHAPDWLIVVAPTLFLYPGSSHLQPSSNLYFLCCMNVINLELPEPSTWRLGQWASAQVQISRSGGKMNRA